MTQCRSAISLAAVTQDAMAKPRVPDDVWELMAAAVALMRSRLAQKRTVAWRTSSLGRPLNLAGGHPGGEAWSRGLRDRLTPRYRDIGFGRV
jgi:hypothetical protein